MSDMPRITMDEVRPEPRLSGRAYHIVTYGCQMNAHDSEQIAGILDRMGMHEAASRDEATWSYTIPAACATMPSGVRWAMWAGSKN